jgi:hypothetical protein
LCFLSLKKQEISWSQLKKATVIELDYESQHTIMNYSQNELDKQMLVQKRVRQ